MSTRQHTSKPENNKNSLLNNSPGKSRGSSHRQRSTRQQSSNRHNILQLQRSIGNRAVGQLLNGNSGVVIQPKLTVNSPGDKYEQEADRAARQVVDQTSAPGQPTVQRQEEEELQAKPAISAIQRQGVEEEEMQMKQADTVQRQEEEELQAKSAKAGGGTRAAPGLEASIQQAKGGGRTLSDNIRAPMEQVFGADFSGVRVHTDGRSDRLNRSIQARAFTTGQDVFFRQGEYNPANRSGKELLAHELTHVVQQNGRAVQRKIREKAALGIQPQLYHSTNEPIVQATLTGTAKGVGIGTAAGAALGSFVPAVGTVVGGFIGGLIGGAAGHYLSTPARLTRNYNQAEVTNLINNSEGQPNMVGPGHGHARERHVQATAQVYVDGFPNNHAEQTKTAYFNTANQDQAATAAINSGPGQAELTTLDNNPAVVRSNAIDVPSPVNNVVRVRGPNAAGAARVPAPIIRPNVLLLIERTPAHQLHIVTCYPKN